MARNKKQFIYVINKGEIAVRVCTPYRSKAVQKAFNEAFVLAITRTTRDEK